MARKRLSPTIIDQAHDIAPSTPPDLPAKEESKLREYAAEMAAKYERSQVDKEHVAGVLTVEQANAKLINEKSKIVVLYANRVFLFLCIYCLLVFFIIIASGFKFYGFNLDPYLLITLAGSTAISAIGLVGIVVSGLFGPLRAKKK